MTLGNSGAQLEAQIERRIVAAVLVVLTVWSGLAGRLFYLQVLEGDRYRVSAERNSVRTHRVDALRGRILDRNGAVLVDSRPSFDVGVVPYQTPSLDVTLERLAGLAHSELSALRAHVGQPRGLERFRPVMALHDLDRDAMARVGERIWALPGVIPEVSSVRHYGYGERAGHLFGRLGEISGDELADRKGQGYRSGDVVGKQGVERLLDRELRGRNGGRNVLVDARGREIEVLNYIAPKPGSNVVLTLDMRLQKLAEDGLDALGKKGAVVALDPRSGEVLVLASRPAFDPNHFADGLDPAEWRALMEDPRKPLLSRAIQGQYPPGSTYKVVTALAGLERGIITPDFRVHCGGSYRLGRRTYRCWKKEGHGSMDLYTALVRSCDVFFYKLGNLLKPGPKLPAVNILAQYAKALGLGRPTQIGIDHEAPGLVPTSEWKERVFREPWMDGETISVAIGQGANQWTPIQMANVYATIGNGGTRYRPHIIRQIIDSETGAVERPEPEILGDAGISKRSFEIVREALRGVINETRGTAYAAMQGLPGGIQAAGKTGTAQLINMPPGERVDTDDLPEQYRDHAWFVGFAPVENPRIAVAVLVENGGHGGSAAAPVAKQVMSAFFENEVRDTQPDLIATPLPSEPPSTGSGAAVPAAAAGEGGVGLD